LRTLPSISSGSANISRNKGDASYSGALGATELELIADLLDTVEVEHEVLGPLSGPLADGDELSCLKVGVGQRGLSCGES
jgi:hypothetical protein